MDDSIAVLDLTITQPDTSYTTITVCESYDWNGTIYTESGTYEYSEQNNNDYSISFDDYNDRIEVPNIYLGNNFSIMMEVKPNDNNDFGEIINIGSNLTLVVDGSLLKLNIKSISNNNNWNFDNSFAYNFNDTSWINLCVNYSNDSLHLYYNGNKVLNGYAHNYNISGLLILGDRNFNSSYSYSYGGKQDNLTLWNTALSQQEIQKYMNCPPTGNESNLVGYWNFEEGEGNTTYDLSGNEKNHG